MAARIVDSRAVSMLISGPTRSSDDVSVEPEQSCCMSHRFHLGPEFEW